MRFSIVLVASVILAQTPPPNRNAIRPIPPPGIEVSLTDRTELTNRLRNLEGLTAKLAGNALLPDVLIYQNAVRYALDNNEFFKADEILKAHRLLDHGIERANFLAEGKSPWTTATGLVARGYVSNIDGSVQPYGLVIPSSFTTQTPHRWRLDAWFHGRAEMLSEVNFVTERETRPGEFTPPHTIVLHLYGRYCNASRFAGEIDFFEALAAVRQHYAIDENRILVRGFSMGGASAWDIGTHHAGLWAAVAPGAGFSETKDFLKLDLTKPDAPFAWEQKLWRMYDATDYALNLANTTTVAYNGDQDGQKQAADAMETSMAKEGIALTRVTGEKTGHRYHPQSKVEINEKLDAAAALGRDPYPKQLQFTTFTLAYNRMKWLIVDSLDKHWERARVDASIESPVLVRVTTTNTRAITLDFGPGGAPISLTSKPTIQIDGQAVTVAAPQSDRSWRVHLRKTGTRWAKADSPRAATLEKSHKVMGPVDHAFMSRFVMVEPSGTPLHSETASWVEAERTRAQREWRKQFRGEALHKKDTEVTPADIASSNLVLWGDPGSNAVLAKLAPRLPIRWTADGITVGKQTYPKTHAAIFVFPNPDSPDHYIVINSGFTFREFDFLNNARQTPKLPDWAVVDTTVAPGPRYPGKIAAAGFFTERWELEP